MQLSLKCAFCQWGKDLPHPNVCHLSALSVCGHGCCPTGAISRHSLPLSQLSLAMSVSVHTGCAKIAHYCASFQVSGFNWFIIYWLYIYIKSYLNTESCQESIAVYHCVWLPSVCDAVLPVADRRICYKYQKCVSNVAEESRVEPWWNESHWETDGSGHRSTRRVLALHIHSRARSQHLTLFD